MTKRHHGFTLLELVVVLAILVILTSMATREIGHVQDQQRYQATHRGFANWKTPFWVPCDRAPDGSLLDRRLCFRTWDARLMPSEHRTGFAGTLGDPSIAFDVPPATPGERCYKRRPAGPGSGRLAGALRTIAEGATDLYDGCGNPYTNALSLLTHHVIACELKGLSRFVTEMLPRSRIASDRVVVRVFSPDPDHPDRILTYATENVFHKQSGPSGNYGLTIGHRVVRAYFATRNEHDKLHKECGEGLILRGGVNQVEPDGGSMSARPAYRVVVVTARWCFRGDFSSPVSEPLGFWRTPRSADGSNHACSRASALALGGRAGARVWVLSEGCSGSVVGYSLSSDCRLDCGTACPGACV